MISGPDLGHFWSISGVSIPDLGRFGPFWGSGILVHFWPDLALADWGGWIWAVYGPIWMVWAWILAVFGLFLVGSGLDPRETGIQSQ